MFIACDRCMDLDGDGYLSMYELEYFYEEQLQRMEALGIETLPFHDCLCQVHEHFFCVPELIVYIDYINDELFTTCFD